MSRDVTIVLKVDNQFSAPLQQFSTEIKGISGDTTELSGATKQADSAFGGLASGVSAAIVAYAGWRGINAVSEMFQLGQSVNVASATFEALTAGIGGSAANMAALRSVTGGVVDDMTLMEGSAKMLQMGIAGNTEELSKMMDMAVHLGSSMGMDVTKSLSDFSLMLANNSIMRLDQFGISSGRVRQKMEELKDSFPGMDKSERFKLAVLDEGAKAMDRLGSAATAAETPLNRIQASVQNLAENFSKSFATGANSLVGMIEIASGKYPGQAESRAASEQLARTQAQSFAKDYFGAMTAYLDMAGVQKGSDDFVSQLMFKTAEALKNNPNADIGTVVNQFVMEAWNKGEPIDITNMQGYIDSFSAAYDLANDEIAVKAANSQTALMKTLYANLLASDSGREFEKGFDMLGAFNDAGGTDDRQASLASQREMLDIAKQRAELFNNLNSNMVGAFGTMGYDTSVTDPSLFAQKLDPSYMKSLVPDFMEQSGADQITRDLRMAEDEFRKLQDLADQKLISDDQLESSKNMVDNLSVMATEAQRAADAYKNLTLAQALGQSGGGMQGEIEDQVLAAMKSNGASKAQIDAMQETLDKQSGRETDSSSELKTKVIPLIAKMSANHAAVAMANLDQFLKDATLQGLSDEQIAAALPGIVADGFGGTSKGKVDTFGKVGGYMGGGRDGATDKDDKKTFATTVMAKDIATMGKDSAVVDKYMATTSDHIKLAATNADKMKTALDTMKTNVGITFKFTADDPMGLVSLVKGLTGGTLGLGTMVKDNGGSVPGQTHTKDGGV